MTPAVNQIEVHPYLAQDDVRAFNTEHGIATEAWSPIAQGGVLKDPTIVRIAESLGRTPAQVTLRWHLQRGDIVFPKSVTRERVEENFALFDFELSETDMADITGLDKGERTGPEPGRVQLHPGLTAFRGQRTTTTFVPGRAKSQIRWDIARLTRTQPWDCRWFVPSRCEEWICAPEERYCGTWWKPMPHGANRTKWCSRSRPLASLLSRIRPARPHFDPDQ